MTSPRGAGEGAWRIAGRAMLAAPRSVQVMLAGSIAYVLAVVLFSTYADGSGDYGAWREYGAPALLAGLLGALGGILLGFAHLLFAVAQGEDTSLLRWRWGLQPRRIHQMLLALPVLAYTSGLLAAVAAGSMVPILGQSPLYWLGFGSIVLVAFAAGRALSDVTRFLYQHAEEQAELAARARAEASDAQLAALQAQMNPHFLFNALNTVAALVRSDPSAAEGTVENLARILRRTLDRSRRASTPLEDELDYLRAYLAIEQERFGERLRVEWEVEDEALAAPVPPMTLQPLVENALKHGIGSRLEGGTIRVSASVSGGNLSLRVEDDGVGFPRRHREGTGLGNLRERLATLYADRAELHVEEAVRGSAVAVRIPVHGG